MPMETRKIGSLDVSIVGLGTNNFGMRMEEADIPPVVDAALEADGAGEESPRGDDDPPAAGFPAGGNSLADRFRARPLSVADRSVPGDVEVARREPRHRDAPDDVACALPRIGRSGGQPPALR